MGFFFLLAGYFTPASLERKGYARFIGDRFLRLGLPLLAFGLVLGPLTAAIVNAAEGRGFWSTIVWLWNHKQFINGPLWFAQALLIFSLGYCALARNCSAPLSTSAGRSPKPVPTFRWWLLCAVGVGAVALAIRQFVPSGVNIIGLQLGYFSSYTFLFALGIAAWKYDWLRQLQWKNVRPWIIALVIAWPTLPIGIAYANKIYGPGKANFGGGLTWPAILYAFWEPFVAWGLIAAWLLFARARMNQPSQFWSWLNRRAYAVIHHPSAGARWGEPASPSLGRACVAQVLRHRNSCMRCHVARFRSVCSHPGSAPHRITRAPCPGTVHTTCSKLRLI